jgi:hypothetical protein
MLLLLIMQSTYGVIRMERYPCIKQHLISPLRVLFITDRIGIVVCKNVYWEAGTKKVTWSPTAFREINEIRGGK